MKNLISRPSSIAILFVSIFMLVGCFKKDNDTPLLKPAGVAFLHASPKNAALDFVDYDTYNGSLLARLNYNTYQSYPTGNNSTTPYRAFYPGTRAFGVARSGTGMFYNIKQFTLLPNRVYNIFAVDSANKAELMLVQDSIRPVDSLKTAIQFINLSPNANQVSFSIDENSTDALSFKSLSPYKITEPKNNATITATLLFNDQRRVVTRHNVNLEKGSNYTIWLRGLVDGNNADTLGISVLKTR